jgi:tRNA (guanine-N7-)-methyltransferase
MSSREDHERQVADRRLRLRLDLQQMLKGVSRLTLEIGAGHGHFLTAYAQAHPEEQCLGLDINGARVRRALSKAEKTGMTTLQFIKAEAVEVLLELPVNVRLERVFILFPDPWPKKRHLKNRLFQKDFLDLLAKRLALGGNVFFRTDYEPFFQWTLDQIAGHPAYLIEEEMLWPFEAPTVFQNRAPSYFSLVARLDAEDCQLSPELEHACNDHPA